jgi:hypothetical protein
MRTEFSTPATTAIRNRLFKGLPATLAKEFKRSSERIGAQRQNEI